jgi:hypothetical protein
VYSTYDWMMGDILGFKFVSSSFIAGALAAVYGCSSSQVSSSSGAFPAEPFMALPTDSGKFSLSLWTAPEQPPSRGVNRVKLEVTDAITATPVDGLAVSIVPWMPSMGHGTSVVPSVAEQGNGVYIADNVNFIMPARWQLRITFSSGADAATGATDSATPSFDIP